MSDYIEKKIDAYCFSICLIKTNIWDFFDEGEYIYEILYCTDLTWKNYVFYRAYVFESTKCSCKKYIQQFWYLMYRSNRNLINNIYIFIIINF